MTASSYLQVANLADIPKGKTLCVELDGVEILLCHTAEGVYAVNNLCTHAAARMSEGKLKACRILCPLHGAAFDVRDGCVLSKPAREPLGTYAVKVEDGQVLLGPINS